MDKECAPWQDAPIPTLPTNEWDESLCDPRYCQTEAIIFAGLQCIELLNAIDASGGRTVSSRCAPRKTCHAQHGRRSQSSTMAGYARGASCLKARENQELIDPDLQRAVLFQAAASFQEFGVWGWRIQIELEIERCTRTPQECQTSFAWWRSFWFEIHSTAINALATLGRNHKIDTTPIEMSAVYCRRLYHRRFEVVADVISKTPDAHGILYWPNCLGLFPRSLDYSQQDVIDLGQVRLNQLFHAMGFDEPDEFLGGGCPLLPMPTIGPDSGENDSTLPTRIESATIQGDDDNGDVAGRSGMRNGPEMILEDNHIPEAPQGLFASAPELANRLGVGRGPVETFLCRHRKDHPDCYVENTNKKANDPTYLFKIEMVWPFLVEKLKSWRKPKSKRSTK